jgi:diketogulonate reductase-like aldo/keto reductase
VRKCPCSDLVSRSCSIFIRLFDHGFRFLNHLGTWKAGPGEVGKAVEIALKAGYRHVDTATAYSNEKEVGEGIKASGVPRNEIFLTTKLSTYDMNPSNVKSAMEYSLKQLDTYIDLCKFSKFLF